MTVRPGDYIIFPTGDHVTYFWRVSGVYYGALGQEDVVGLQSVNSTPPVAHGDDVEEMFVPLALVQDHVFRRVFGSGNLTGSPRRASS